MTTALYGSPTKPCPLRRSTVVSCSDGRACWQGTRKGLPATVTVPTASVTLYSPLIGATYVTCTVRARGAWAFAAMSTRAVWQGMALDTSHRRRITVQHTVRAQLRGTVARRLQLDQL